jgi:hypothetical protein
MKIDLKNATINFKSGGTGSNLKTLEIKIGDGNITWAEKRNMEYTLDRGQLDTVREGDEVPVDVKIDLVYEFLTAATGDTVPTPEDVLKHRGPASTWISSSSDPCEPFAIDVEVVYTPACGGEDPETVLIQDYRWEQLDHDPKAGTLSTSGKANVKEATVTRG